MTGTAVTVTARSRTDTSNDVAKALSNARSVGILLGIAAALVSFRSPIMPSVINVSAVAVAAALAIAVLSSPRGSLGSLRVTGIDLVFGSYIAVRIVLEYLASTEFSVPFGSGTILDLIIGYLAFTACRIVVRDVESFFAALVGVAVPGVLVAAIAVAQILGPPDISSFLISHFNSGGLETRIAQGWEIRGTSTIGHWTALGGYLSFVAAILAAKIVADHRSGSASRWGWLWLAVVVLGQVSTLTFATIAVTAAVLASMLYCIGVRPVHLLVGLVGALVAWAALGGMLTSRIEKQMYESSTGTTKYPLLPESVAFRVDVWVSESIPAIMERPFVGWGIGTYRYFGTEASSDYLKWISPESEWIRTAVTAGIPALIWQVALLSLVVLLLKRLRNLVDGSFIDPLYIAVIAILVASFIHSHIANRGVPLVLWPIVGAGVSLAMTLAKSTSPTEQEGQ